MMNKHNESIKNFQVKFVNPEEDDRWDAFLETHPLAVVYHHSSWIKTIRKTYHYDCYSLAVEDENASISAILPVFYVKSPLTGKRLVSSPFSPFCGPLARKPEFINHLLYALENQARKLNVDYIQLHCNYNSLPVNRENYTLNNFYKIHQLDLRPELNTIISNYHNSCIRRPFLKSLKNGINLKVAESEDDVEIFYNLQVQTRKRQGVPPQPLVYFLNMWKSLNSQEIIKILMAQYKSRVIAAIVLLRYKDTVIYQNGASDQQYLYLKPNHFLLGKAIEMSKDEGYTFFNFGTSAPVDKGLIQFKQRWGTKEYYLPYYYYPRICGKRTNMEASFKYRVAKSIFHHMPVSLLKKIGEISYRHIA